MARFICTLAPASDITDRAASRFREWLARGMHAGMEYLDRHHDLRLHPAGLLAGAKSVIAAAFPYIGAGEVNICPGIAAYAVGDDYHDVIRDYLSRIVAGWRDRAGGEWRICIDSAPVPERFWAVKSGLAIPTRSGNVAVEGLGTKLFLALMLTTLPPARAARLLEESCGTDDDPGEKEGIFRGVRTGTPVDPEIMAETLCGECCRCLEACPGKAICPGGVIDARRCLSYLTIEHRGAWTEPSARAVMHSPAGRRTLFGCDVCVRVCPLNTPVKAAVSPLEALGPRREYIGLTPRKIADMTQEEFSATFRRSAIKRAKLAGLRRNALNCLREDSPADDIRTPQIPSPQ
ncbi:MAG: DUF1730 domain-containing protein [Muribaculaceae bacterium]|nr:DUF1730 domain-containing protein [Muribaculaceae bacterium]